MLVESFRNNISCFESISLRKVRCSNFEGKLDLSFARLLDFSFHHILLSVHNLLVHATSNLFRLFKLGFSEHLLSRGLPSLKSYFRAQVQLSRIFKFQPHRLFTILIAMAILIITHRPRLSRLKLQRLSLPRLLLPTHLPHRLRLNLDQLRQIPGIFPGPQLTQNFLIIVNHRLIFVRRLQVFFSQLVLLLDPFEVLFHVHLQELDHSLLLHIFEKNPFLLGHLPPLLGNAEHDWKETLHF